MRPLDIWLLDRNNVIELSGYEAQNRIKNFYLKQKTRGTRPRVLDLTEEARTARTWLLLFLLLLLTLPLLKFTFQALPELFCELLPQQLSLQMSDTLHESKNNWICPFALFQLHLLAPGHRSRRSSR